MTFLISFQEPIFAHITGDGINAALASLSALKTLFANFIEKVPLDALALSVPQLRMKAALVTLVILRAGAT
jgi:uncharacterized membrane protein YdbT with pleckstrin-like domain